MHKYYTSIFPQFQGRYLDKDPDPHNKREPTDPALQQQNTLNPD